MVPLVWGKTVSYRLCEVQSKGILKRDKMLFLDLAPHTLQNSGIFHDSTRPHLHCPLWRFAAEITAIRRLYIKLSGALQVLQKKNIVVLVWSGAAHPPIAV